MLNLATTLATITFALGSMVLPAHNTTPSKTMENKGDIKTLTVTSSAFAPNGMIPDKYSCKGENENPPLHIEGIPEGTKCLVVIMDDPDAMRDGGFTHWVMWNADPTMTDIPEGYHGASQGFNSDDKRGYIGPCPPQGTHHFHFKVYALRSLITIPPDSYKERVEKAMKGRILAQGELVGRFTKMK